MSITCNTYIYYGIPMIKIEEDWENIIMKEYFDLYEKYDEKGDWLELSDYYIIKTGHSFDVDWKKKEKILKDSGCEFLRYGHAEGDETNAIITSESLIKGDLWTPKKIEVMHLASSVKWDEWDGLLKDFCEVIGYPFEGPSWYVGAYYSR